MRIALFGGTFDPIHSGHLRAARAAARKFHLDRVLFVPSGNPPHKVDDHLTPFVHRYAMVALAVAREPKFVASLLESPTPDGRRRYSIDTVRAAKRRLSKHDELFFILGADAFLDLPHWKSFARLIRSTNFIVVSRPGFCVEQIAGMLPAGTRGKAARPDLIRLKSTTIRILAGLDVAIASRGIREAVRAGKRITGLVPPLVEEYIEKEGLYRPATSRRLTR
jgi:nicotinate-nucleotide adenylyltransferase